VGVVWRRRTARAVLFGLAAVHVAEALMLRRRRSEIPTLSPPEGTPDAGNVEKGRAISAQGCHVTEPTLATASAEMEACGADVVDLVPGDVPAERALDLLRWMNPERLRDDPLYYGPGLADAVVVRAPVAERMGIAEGGESLDRGDLVRRIGAAHRHARSVVLRVAPDLAAPAVTPHDRWREIEEATAWSRPYGSLAPVLYGAQTAWLLALTAGPFVAPVAGLAALAAWSSQPLLALGGTTSGGRDVTANRTPDPTPHLSPGRLATTSLLRLPRAWRDHVRMLRPALRQTRAAYTRLAATPTMELPSEDERFDARHETCPWCNSPELVAMFDIPDLQQQKPGTTHLDRCADCGHVFQNPPLSIKGLDYYYEHFYEGIGADLAEHIFSKLTPTYAARVEAVARFTEPRAWLDVGTGYGHFCAVARRRWPDATFDALDFGETVEEGQRRGWVDTAYRGLFPDVAGSLPRSYDVVSMHHYLEHTRDPRLELAAAAKVLEPGGYLMIEVPDPESPWLRRLGRWGVQWSQPQHQHFVPCGNLVTELGKLGFEVVSIQRGDATLGQDLTGVVLLWVQEHSRNAFVPWLPPPTAADRLKRAAVILAALPAFGVTALVDAIKDARTGPEHIGNTYRVVARRT
jgi:SAM-dependent methyltransferase